MGRFTVGAGLFTILAGQTSSNTLTARNDYGDADTMGLVAVAIDGARTYKFQVSYDDGTTWVDWTDGTSNIIPPISGTGAVYGPASFSAIKILANGGVATDSTWRVSKTIGGRL